MWLQMTGFHWQVLVQKRKLTWWSSTFFHFRSFTNTISLRKIYFCFSGKQYQVYTSEFLDQWWGLGLAWVQTDRNPGEVFLLSAEGRSWSCVFPKRQETVPSLGACKDQGWVWQPLYSLAWSQVFKHVRFRHWMVKWNIISAMEKCIFAHLTWCSIYPYSAKKYSDINLPPRHGYSNAA